MTESIVFHAVLVGLLLVDLAVVLVWAWREG